MPTEMGDGTRVQQARKTNRYGPSQDWSSPVGFYGSSQHTFVGSCYRSFSIQYVRSAMFGNFITLLQLFFLIPIHQLIDSILTYNYDSSVFATSFITSTSSSSLTKLSTVPQTMTMMIHLLYHYHHHPFRSYIALARRIGLVPFSVFLS